MRRWPNVCLLLGQRRRRWANSKPTLGKCRYSLAEGTSFKLITYICCNNVVINQLIDNYERIHSFSMQSFISLSINIFNIQSYFKTLIGPVCPGHKHRSSFDTCLLVWCYFISGGGPRVVDSTAAFHARARDSFPCLGGLKETKMFLPHPLMKLIILGSLRDREVACLATDRQGSNFKFCVWRAVPSHPQEVLLAQLRLYVHKGGLKPHSFQFILLYILYWPTQQDSHGHQSC